MLYRAAMQFRENRQSVAHSDQVLNALQDLSGGGGRSGNQRHESTCLPAIRATWPPYDHATRQPTGSNLEQLRTLTADNPSQQARLGGTGAPS